jgi:cytochrome c oxidase subunit IV
MVNTLLTLGIGIIGAWILLFIFGFLALVFAVLFGPIGVFVVVLFAIGCVYLAVKARNK